MQEEQLERGDFPTEAAQEEAQLTPDDTALREELLQAQARVEELERERFLLRAGVPEEDLDYYAFKIGKLVTEERDFRTAAKSYLKEHAPAKQSPRLSTGASLEGRAFSPPTVNETMNRLLRGN